MTAAPSPASAARRYVLLTALRWLPTGISLPGMALLAASRGLSPADVGLVFAAYSVVALVLELPTGGLADALGTRPVLVAAAVLQGAGALGFAVAGSVAGFALAMGLLGAGRALDSGPLESWYVDTVARADPAADPTPGLARASSANAIGLTVGAVLGGLTPAAAERWGRDGDVLALPFVLAAGLVAVYLVAVLLLVAPLPRPAGTGASPSGGVRSVPALVRDTVAGTLRDAALRRLAGITLLTGVVLATLESIGPLHFGALAGDAEAGTAVFGTVMAVSFAAAAAGAALAPAVGRLARGSVAAASTMLALVCAAAVAGVGAGSTVVVAGLACAAFYLANAAGWPLRQRLLHARVDAGHRSTTVSAMSVALMVGGIAGNLVVPRLAGVVGLPWCLALTAVPLLAVAVLSLRLPRPADVPDGAGEAVPVAGAAA
ncbi:MULTISPECIES: MFS transporter [unclassified Blastococcus]